MEAVEDVNWPTGSSWRWKILNQWEAPGAFWVASSKVLITNSSVWVGDWGFLHTAEQVSRHQPGGILQLNSILTLPGDCTMLHRLRVQSYGGVQVVTCTSDQLATNQRFPKPPPQVQLICWSGSESSEKRCTYWIMVYYKRTRQKIQTIIRWKRCLIGEGMGKGHRACVSSESARVPKPPLGHHPWSSPNPILLGFVEAPLHRQDWWKHWPQATNPGSSPSPCLRGQLGGTEIFNHLITQLAPGSISPCP